MRNKITGAATQDVCSQGCGGRRQVGLTDEAVEHGVACVVGRDRVLAVDDAELRPVLKRVLPEAEQVQDAAQRLQEMGRARRVSPAPPPIWSRSTLARHRDHPSQSGQQTPALHAVTKRSFQDAKFLQPSVGIYRPAGCAEGHVARRLQGGCPHHAPLG